MRNFAQFLSIKESGDSALEMEDSTNEVRRCVDKFLKKATEHKIDHQKAVGMLRDIVSSFEGGTDNVAATHQEPVQIPTQPQAT